MSIVVVAIIAVGIWLIAKNQVETKEQEAQRNVNVADLKDSNEQKLGTIYYPGAKVIDKIKHEDSKYKVTFKTTDSLDGAVAIYYQDILNRYKSYDVDKKVISKDGTKDGKATVITCSGVSGKIVITSWSRDDGLTQIEVETSDNFK